MENFIFYAVLQASMLGKKTSKLGFTLYLVIINTSLKHVKWRNRFDNLPTLAQQGSGFWIRKNVLHIFQLRVVRRCKANLSNSEYIRESTT